MFETLKNAWKIDDLRKKILFTLLILVIYRVGVNMPVPFLDIAGLQALVAESALNDTIFAYINVISGGAFSNATIFALGIMPAINASIIVQLLTFAIPALERWAKEGEEGKRKLGRVNKYASLALSIVMGYGYYTMLRYQYKVVNFTKGGEGVFAAIVIIAVLVAGASLSTWLGERITAKGIGNGLSMLVFINCISRLPDEIKRFYIYLTMAAKGETKYFFYVPLMVAIMIATLIFIIFMTNAERRIPIQYAKRVVGRKMYGGQSTHMPIKVSMSGVLPIIFASSILSVPMTIGMFVRPETGSFWDGFLKAFSTSSPIYAVLYFLLIIVFNYFYVAMQYNPIEMANNLKKNSGGVPGIRPGKPTSDFLQKVVGKVTFIGAIFLGIVAVLPIIVGMLTGMQTSLAGTSLIIAVGVALETVRALESQMMMRHYKGFLE